MSGSVKTRSTKNTADFVTESGQLRLPAVCASVPAKSISSSSPRMVTATTIDRSRGSPRASSSSTSAAR